jgi:hypothetical protein
MNEPDPDKPGPNKLIASFREPFLLPQQLKDEIQKLA